MWMPQEKAQCAACFMDTNSDIQVQQALSDTVWKRTIVPTNYSGLVYVIYGNRCPRDPDQKLIKRVIAVEGETIRCSDRRRYVSIPMGHCWVEGDHVTHSMDSNYFGPVSTGLIFAKASHIVWPPSRWQKLDSEMVQTDRQPFPCPRRTWEAE